MGTVELFRVQNAKGEGLYHGRHGCISQQFTPTGAKRFAETTPMPYQDEVLGPKLQTMDDGFNILKWRFAFPSVAAYMSWVGHSKWRAELANAGLRLVVLAVPEGAVLQGRTQSIYAPSKAAPVDTLDLATLEPVPMAGWLAKTPVNGYPKKGRLRLPVAQPVLMEWAGNESVPQTALQAYMMVDPDDTIEL